MLWWFLIGQVHKMAVQNISDDEVSSLKEEAEAVKLREAAANSTLKDLMTKVGFLSFHIIAQLFQ
jgi:hypothetical protein